MPDLNIKITVVIAENCSKCSKCLKCPKCKNVSNVPNALNAPKFPNIAKSRKSQSPNFTVTWKGKVISSYYVWKKSSKHVKVAQQLSFSYYYDVWTLWSKHVEVAQQLSFSSSSYYYSTGDSAKLFLPQFTSNRLQVLAQWSLGIEVSCYSFLLRSGQWIGIWPGLHTSTIWITV